jgi:hypothetical protein
MQCCKDKCGDAEKKAAVIGVLMRAGATSDAPLHDAAQYGVLDLLAARIAEGADINARDEVIRTHVYARTRVLTHSQTQTHTHTRDLLQTDIHVCVLLPS